MMYVKVDVEFRTSFPMSRDLRITLFKMTDRFNEPSGNVFKMTVNLKAVDEYAALEQIAEFLKHVRDTVRADADERAKMYPLVVTNLQIRSRRGR